ncbi:Cleavage and polyadenylation specificity factor subunit [Enterospora canceri]|uniref:Cleavage and polyadenylation specificity factor subunit n=1 Tax=Enterospora canceri TaxID=1081671 RepID=A0A1Y1SAP7_9MICR|nr:Cleavage and polyadenylation specificity factor subunit [Enterospora canceri]
MHIIPLGAGQDVGKSCILVSIQDKTIMFDCGMHMGYHDRRKFPDFSYFEQFNNFNAVVDVVIISHFHIDHCGALPYFTEVLGFDGPIFMTHPTKAALPIILEDSRKLLEMKNSGDKLLFTTEQINTCLKKVITVNMNETYEIEDNFILRPYYAGHVIGAAMFYVEYKGESVVYTGDFSTLADRHLRSATIDRLSPDLLITESTYGGVLRECKKAKERRMLQIIQDTIDEGGKVLIPIFALGRAQEICLLIENYWERMGLKVPIYFSMGITSKVNDVYSRYSNYTNQTVQEKLEKRNVFDFNFIKPFYRAVLESDEPMVIFATPAMLHSGSSLAIFRSLCGDKRNSVILPGFCSRGTVGEKIMNGLRRIEVGRNVLDVNLNVHNVAFSAHADMAGILKIVEQCRPKNIVLVHGDKSRMQSLKNKIDEELGIPVYHPANGVMIEIPRQRNVAVRVKRELIEKHVILDQNEQEIDLCLEVEKEGEKVVVKSIQSNRM